MTAFKILNETEHHRALMNHLILYSDITIACKHVQDSERAKVLGVVRSFVGNMNSIDNMIFDWDPQEEWDKQEKSWDDRIREQIRFFSDREIPFTWHLEEDHHPDLREALERNGFRNDSSTLCLGGVLDESLPQEPVPDGYEIAHVETEEDLKLFTSLAFKIFAEEGEEEGEYLKLYQNPSWNHWMVKDATGKVVSIRSTLITDQSMSFWNGATDEDHRCKGLNSSLARVCMVDAAKKGCKIWSSFLDSGSMAEGLLTKLGGKPICTLDVYNSPPLANESCDCIESTIVD